MLGLVRTPTASELSEPQTQEQIMAQKALEQAKATQPQEKKDDESDDVSVSDDNSQYTEESDELGDQYPDWLEVNVSEGSRSMMLIWY